MLAAEKLAQASEISINAVTIFAVIQIKNREPNRDMFYGKMREFGVIK
jgi:hypothetical protein